MTAKEKLIEVVAERKWYKDTMNPATARSFKRHLLLGKNISENKIKEILYGLGYEPKKKETIDSLEVW